MKSKVVYFSLIALLVMAASFFGTSQTVSAADCVIPVSGPWPPCATGNAAPSNPAPSGNLCPVSGAWPAGCTPRGATAPAPAPAAPTGNACPTSGAWPAGCVPGGAAPAPAPATDAGMQIVAVNKRSEFVDLENRSNQGVNLQGWVLVSENGNQRCELRGWLPAGERMRVFAQQGIVTGMQSMNCDYTGPIWNNSQSDDAILLNPQGEEVFRFDS